MIFLLRQLQFDPRLRVGKGSFSANDFCISDFYRCGAKRETCNNELPIGVQLGLIESRVCYKTMLRRITLSLALNITPRHSKCAYKIDS